MTLYLMVWRRNRPSISSSGLRRAQAEVKGVAIAGY
jgi:hypothetical protein